MGNKVTWEELLAPLVSECICPECELTNSKISACIKKLRQAEKEGKVVRNPNKWIKGEPPEAMWCLATYLTNDTPPCEAVAYLWFNADALPKWWIGSAGKSFPFNQEITHWMEIPKSANRLKKGEGRC